MERNAECQNDNQKIYPFPFLSESDILVVETAPSDGGHLMLYPALLSAVVTRLFNECGNKHPGDNKGNGKVDDDNPCKIIQVFLQEVRKPHDNDERCDGGQQSRQYGKEGFPVMVVTVMVNHHDSRIYHHTQRHRDAGKRINVQSDVKDVIGNDRNQDIGCQCHSHDTQIVNASFGQPYKEHEDEQRKQRAPHQFVQFFPFLLGCVIRQCKVDPMPQSVLYAFYPFFDFFRRPDLVGLGIHMDVHVYAVKTVYTEITVRQTVFVFIRCQVVQIYGLPACDAYGYMFQRLVAVVGHQV